MMSQFFRGIENTSQIVKTRSKSHYININYDIIIHSY